MENEKKDAVISTKPDNAVAVAPTPPSPKKSKKRWIILIVILIILFMMFGRGLFFLLIGADSDPEIAAPENVNVNSANSKEVIRLLYNSGVPVGSTEAGVRSFFGI